jgi:hypothetical protein
VAANGFVTTAPAYVKVTSEQWYWSGPIDLYEYANVVGTALGLPGGSPLEGANASLCAVPLSGYGAGPCFTTVLTGFEGTFFLSAPAGNYVLQLNGTFYNDSYLPVSLAPGATLPVGSIFVDEYGTATGELVSSTTDAALSTGTVAACESWGTGVCVTPVAVGSDGRFAISGPPGPYVLEASSPGYQTVYDSVTLLSGKTTQIPAFVLIPIGPGNEYTISGTVTSVGLHPLPLADAVVHATGEISTFTAANGSYTLHLYWGTYTVTASLPGYVSVSQQLDVQGSMSGRDFALPVQTYAVTGTVVNGLTGGLVSDSINISQDGTVIGTSSSGSFSVALPNGTYTLVASDPANPWEFTPVSVVVVVDGAPVQREVTLFPPAVTVDGTVANSLTGQAVGGASVTLAGKTSQGTSWQTTTTTDANGRFSLSAYPGTYTVSANGAGFEGAQQSVSLTANGTATVPVALTLAPIQSSSGSSGPSAAAMWEVAAGVVVAAGALIGLLLYVRRPPSRRRPTPSNARTRGSE